MMKKMLAVVVITAICTLLAACTAKEKPPIETSAASTSNEPEKARFAPFEVTLDKSEDKERFITSPPDFLTEEQKELWSNAYYLTYMSLSGKNFGFKGEYEKSPRKTESGNEYHYIKTGVDYDSFYDSLAKVFTEEYLTDVFLGETYICSDGEVLFLRNSLEEDISYRTHTYQLISQSDDEIRFQLTSFYSWDGIAKLGNLDKGESVEHYEEHFFKMVKTADGWRFSEFDYWL